MMLLVYFVVREREAPEDSDYRHFILMSSRPFRTLEGAKRYLETCHPDLRAFIVSGHVNNETGEIRNHFFDKFRK